jgi:hypothetical protein
VLLALVGAVGVPWLASAARHFREVRQQRLQREIARRNLEALRQAMFFECGPPHGIDERGRRWDLPDLIPGARVAGANFSRAVWRAATLRGVRFVRCDLSFVDLSGADLRGAVFKNCSIGATDFSGADLRGADLHEVGLGVDCCSCDYDEAYPVFAGALYDRRTRWPDGIVGVARGARLVE